MKIKLEKLPVSIQSGDWHDPLMRWAVIGPGNERQHFAFKRAANLYKKCRKSAVTQEEAVKIYCLAED